MKINPISIVLLAVGSAAALGLSAQAALIHRYSFNETSGTTVRDSVGTANGVIKGNGAFFDGGGRLALPGGTGSAEPEATVSGYVDLPNHMINVLTNISIEAWVMWDNTGSWQRIFDFGTSAGGEDVVNGNGNYLFLSPQGPDNMRFAVRDPATGAEPTQITAPARLELSTETCVTVTYDYNGNAARLYSNAVLVASGPAAVDLKTINDVNNWLGRSQWNDPMFMGSYNEFRIYDSALNPLEVTASYTSGPATPSTDVNALGALQTVRLNVLKTTMTEADKQTATVAADFAQATNLPLAGVPGATLESDNTNVITVSAAGELTAVGAGTATLTASFQGKSASTSITVTARQTGLATAGTLYVDLRASDVSSDTGTWRNRAGKGDFTATGSPVYVANVGGTGLAGVQFEPATDAYMGPNTTDDLDGSGDRSIEVWAYNPTISDEETLVAWGHRGGPDGSNMSFNYGINGDYGAVGHWGSPDMGWGPSGVPAAGQWHYLVYTYDGDRTAKVYADGFLKTTENLSAPLNTYATLPIRIGAQAVNDGPDFDHGGRALSGAIALVRVHGGKLTDADVANNYFFGVELTEPGALEGISLKLGTNVMIGTGARTSANVTANFANRKYLSLSGYATFESSDPNIITVNNSGLVTSVNFGSADVIAKYQGKEARVTVQVVDTPPAVLIHRYSFSEAAGSTTAKDSVGTANGNILGVGADFDGRGQLLLPGGTGSAADPVAGYVDLPNHIINVLTNVSFEAWVTWEGSGSWQRIFDFGTSAGGEDIVNGNGNYLFLSPQGPGNTRFAVRDPATGAEPVQLTASRPLPTASEVYLAVTYNYSGNASKLYSNAVQIVSGPASVALRTIDDVNNWLGRSQWNDPMFQGKFNEFRIWDGVMSADQITAAYVAGPDKLPEVSAAKHALTFGLSTDKKLVLGWPSAATGFILETTPALGPQAQWTSVDISGAVDEGSNKKLTLTPQNATQFYRLKK